MTKKAKRQDFTLSERVRAKLAVFMPMRAVLAREMTLRTGLATFQGLVFSARVTNSL
ncbi:MAG TPA: hypothetical protein VN643_03600 [Pyrinomonadaceae bacterium]|nr:hypothetical protein [Pyrinomonadaceae bacterium]